MVEMIARYDLRCPKPRCTETVIETRSSRGHVRHTCKRHGQIVALPRLSAVTLALTAPPATRERP